MMKTFSYLAASLLLLFVASCSLPVNTPTSASQAAPSDTSLPTSMVNIVSPTPEPSLTSMPPTEETAALPEATQSPVSVWTPSAAIPRRYAVILVEKDDVLNIRSGAGAGYDVIGSFVPDEKDIQSTGQSAVIDGQVWMQVKNPSGGTGWVNAWYLTEFVSKHDFCSDDRVNILIEHLKQAINDENGDLLETLVSPAHGLELYYWRGGNTANYSPEEASWLFKSTYNVNWGSGPSGMDDTGTFRQFPLPSLQEVLNDEDLELQCNDSSSASMYIEPWPQMYSNVRFYVLYKPGTPNVDLDWAIWLAGVEYVEGEPYLFALIRFVWEP